MELRYKRKNAEIVNEENSISIKVSINQPTHYFRDLKLKSYHKVLTYYNKKKSLFRNHVLLE